MTLYVLDSDHRSLHQRGYEPLKPHLLIVPPEQLSITIISVEELIRGRLAQVRRALQPENRVTTYAWLSKTFDFLKGFQVLNYDATAESHFQSLLAQKLRIGTQDLKIAAIVLSQNAILVTRNYRDFGKIPQLRMANWASG